MVPAAKGLHLKDAHGSVPDNGLGALQGRLEFLDGLGANVPDPAPKNCTVV